MRLLSAGLVGVCVAGCAGLLAGCAAGGLSPLLAWAALGLGATAGVGAWISTRGLPPGEPVRGWAAWGVVTVFALFALRAFCWLAFVKDGAIAFLSPNNLGDLSLHLTYIRYFANGAPFWPDNPIFAAGRLHYPFGVDLFNALLGLAGVDTLRGLVWVGLLGALAAGVALWRWGGAFALAGFLFNGGVTGFAIFFTHRLADYQSAVDWKCIPLALFVTQRGLLYAVPAGLALLWSWRERILRGGRGLPFWMEVLLYATLPLFHLHTFLFLSAMLGAWMLGGGAAIRRGALRMALAAFVPATALIWMLTDGFRSGGGIHLDPGWIGRNQSPLLAWTLNFGVWPVMIALFLEWLWHRRGQPRTTEFAALVLPAVALFGVACVVIFAPWEWDNTKLMLWCYLAILPPLWAMLRGCRPWLRAAVCWVLFFSGAVSLVGGLDGTHAGYTLAERKELDGLAALLRAIPIGATFACAPTYNHPLLLLGRKVVAGYEGHLSSHGIDYRPRFAALESLLRGEPGWQAQARQLGVDYLFWGKREREKYGAACPWSGIVPVAVEGEWGALYDLRGITPSPGR